MRTRTSNRTKRYTVEKYDFESSSDEREPPKRRKNADQRDENFDGAAESAGDGEENGAGQLDGEEGAAVGADSDASESDVNDDASDASDASVVSVGDKFSRQTVRPIKPFNVRAVVNTGYRDMEPMPPDGHPSRGYNGPFDRNLRCMPLHRVLYGPQEERLRLLQRMLDRWMSWTVLPPKNGSNEHGLTNKGMWAPNFLEKEAYFAERWYEVVKERLSKTKPRSTLSPEQAQPYQFPPHQMPVLVGPTADRLDVKFQPGDSYCISQAGIPFEKDEYDDKIPSGCMFDTGGFVLAMDWAPRTSKGSPQLLALGVVPHADQENYNFAEESVKPDFQQHGVVQLWEFTGEMSKEGLLRPSTKAPRRWKTLCFDYLQRVKRVRWGPVCGLLAVLGGDGRVCVLDVGDEGDGTYEKVDEPLAIFGLVDEQDVKATAMTWVTFNKLAVGYTDGSIALWSVCPNRLLSRHPVHHNRIVDMASGYPSVPYAIMSTPVGGPAKLCDLQAPSYETTEVQSSSVHTQPNLTVYSDHCLGFLSIYPSATPFNTMIGFMHHAQFPIVRRLFTADSLLSCISVGRTHPFLLIGTQDGSLWGTNPQNEIFGKRRETTNRIRIFQHEHRPATLFDEDSPASKRGASRILQGFEVEKNRNPKMEIMARSSGKKGKKKKKEAPVEDVVDDDDDETAGPADPSRTIIYEPLARITVVEWNPNEEYGCWAAAALGSGLVRVMDLGLEVPPDDTD